MLARKSVGKYIGMALLTLVMLTLVPLSISYAEKPDEHKEKRAENFVELAERAGEKVGNFLDLIYANETAIETITIAGLDDELARNKTLFETWGMGNLTKAKDSLEAGEYEYAVANATQALSIFREVFKALNTILADSEVQRGQLIEAQGLIEAMKRALERIEKLREIAPDEISTILESAEKYLNITTAIAWLREGRVNETAWNKTQANQLISLAHSLLRKKAEELNVKRIRSYLTVIENFHERLDRVVDKAIERGLVGAEDLKEELEDVKPLVDDARSLFEAGDYSAAITKLTQARSMLKEIEQDLPHLSQG